MLERAEYIDLVADCLEHLDPSIVIHRVTGDGPKDLLIAPLWAMKREVLNLLHQERSRACLKNLQDVRHNLWEIFVRLRKSGLRRSKEGQNL